LKFYRVEKRDQRTRIRGPLVIEESLRDFWQSSERDHRFLQKLILGRNEDPSRQWWYAVDRTTFMALLQRSFPTDESKQASGDRPAVLPFSVQQIHTVEGSQRSDVPKSPQAFVHDHFIDEKRKGRLPTIVECEHAWVTAGRRGHREDVREAARQELRDAGRQVSAGRPKNSPK
jgi:hypothetical protein